MREAQAEPERLPEVEASPPARLGPLGLGLAVLAGLLAAQAVFETAVESAQHLLSVWTGGRPYATALIVQLLIAFLFGARAALLRGVLSDVAALRGTLGSAAPDPGRLLRELRGVGGLSGVLAPCLGLALGLLVIPDADSGVPYLLSERPWEHHYVWALCTNALLFALMGRLVYETFLELRVMARLETKLGPVDLLDLEPLERFARPGLRSAQTWFVGSALASLIFLNVGFHWATGVVLLATLTVGALALVLPVRGLHRRVVAAKRQELSRVREEIRRERSQLLAHQGESGRLPALLAYEARIERVREWPFDVPTLLRFLALALLATGSWLGGAVVERLLGAALD